jgi:hypothetical protein
MIGISQYGKAARENGIEERTQIRGDRLGGG